MRFLILLFLPSLAFADIKYGGFAKNNKDNNWTAPQTLASSVTVNAAFQVGGGTFTARADGQVIIYQATKAFINTQLTPVVGGFTTCTDCARPYMLCVGTGTTIGQQREIGTATGCY